jgi:hypothetical protein
MAKKSLATPPYVPRKGLRAVLDQVQSQPAGTAVAREDLHKRGLSSHWTYPALAALRFLKILDEDDRLTGRHIAFNRENPDRPAQQALLREAYSDFFDEVRLPLADDEELRAKFQEVYKLSERVANSACPVFEMLASEAGLKLTAATSLPAKEAQLEPQAGEGAGDAQAAPETELVRRLGPDEPVRIRHTGYQIVINLNVNKYTTEKDLIRMVRTANRAIHLLKKSGESH